MLTLFIFLTVLFFITTCIGAYFCSSKDQIIKKLQDEGMSQHLQNMKLTGQAMSAESRVAQAEQHFNEKLEIERKNFAEREELIKVSKEQLSESFKALSSEVLSQAGKDFINLAEQNLGTWQEKSKNELETKHKEVESLITPIKEVLGNLDNKLSSVDKHRISTASALQESIKGLTNVQDSLRKETSNLVSALKAPNIRGRWAEITLRKTVELAGMVEHCDFNEQVSINTEDGKLRPDMVIRLPNNKHIVVDSKAPLAAFIDSVEAQTPDIRAEKLKEHSKQVKAHINILSSKAYHQQFEDTPDFTLMYLPGEMFFNAAVEQDSELVEYAFQRGIIITTPSSFMATLKAISYSWKQEQLAKNAKVICELGTELYDRVRTFVNNFTDIKSGLDKTITSYNRAVTSLETRVLVTARKLTEIGVSNEEQISDLEQVDKAPKLPSIDS